MHVDTDSQKLKAGQNYFGQAWSKISLTSLVMELKLTVSQKWTNGINWFSACWYKFRKGKSWLNDFFGGCGQKWSWSFSSRDRKTCCILRINLWIELFFWMLIVMQWFLVRLISYFLTFKFWGFTTVVLHISFLIKNAACIILGYMNSKHQNIKFTFTHEENNLLYFIWNFFCYSGKRHTLVYRKPIFSDVLTNSESFFIHIV